jgi:hypothetical protein
VTVILRGPFGWIARNDDAAIESAKQFINGHEIELWQRDRIIAKCDPKLNRLASLPAT